jgi:hypothetical protein
LHAYVVVSVATRVLVGEVEWPTAGVETTQLTSIEASPYE